MGAAAGSFLPAFLAGSIAGGSGTLVGFPFDTLKTRYQLQISSAERLGWRTLFRGCWTPTATAGVVQSLCMGIYDTVRRGMHRGGSGPLDHTQDKLINVMVGASVSGLAISPLTCAISRIKVLQQTAGLVLPRGEHSAPHRTKLTNPMGASQRLSTQQALRSLCATGGLFVGLRVTAVMESFRAVYMGTFVLCKRTLSPPPPPPPRSCVPPPHRTMVSSSHGRDRHRGGADASAISSAATPLWVRVVSGGVAGCAGWFSVYPLDQVRSIMQAQPPAAAPTSTAVRAQEVARRLWAEGGVRRLYRGLSYTMMRAAPVAATVLPIYDLALERLQRAI